jgi:hypothetical protein
VRYFGWLVCDTVSVPLIWESVTNLLQYIGIEREIELYWWLDFHFPAVEFRLVLQPVFAVERFGKLENGTSGGLIGSADPEMWLCSGSSNALALEATVSMDRVEGSKDGCGTTVAPFLCKDTIRRDSSIMFIVSTFIGAHTINAVQLNKTSKASGFFVFESSTEPTKVKLI